jgi:hypothetical protein
VGSTSATEVQGTVPEAAYLRGTSHALFSWTVSKEDSPDFSLQSMNAEQTFIEIGLFAPKESLIK